MKRLFAKILLITAVLGLVQPATAFAATPAPELSAGTAILIDATTGEILYQKDMDGQRYPASTTKIITALLTLENLPLDKVVTIDAETPFVGGSRIYLIEGEEITVRDLLYAMMVESANDAADALAKEIGGSMDNFLVMANAKARELGATNTNFTNPHGLHDDMHVSTAHDLALIAKAALQNEQFREVVTTTAYTIEATNKQEARTYLYNTNNLLHSEWYDGITGVKTGYTPQAGGTLVASARRYDTELIAVVMQSTEAMRFTDTRSLLDWGFNNYKTAIGMTSGTSLGETELKKGSVGTVKLELAGDIMATIPAEMAYEDVRTVIELKENLTAPVEKGEVAGVLRLFRGTEYVGDYDVVFAESVEVGGILSNFGIDNASAHKIFLKVFLVIAAIAALFFGYVSFRQRQIRMKKRRKQQRRERQMKREAAYQPMSSHGYAPVGRSMDPSRNRTAAASSTRGMNNVTSLDERRRDLQRRKDYARRGSGEYVYRYCVR